MKYIIPNVQNLCALSEELGYRGSYQQLMLPNGSAVSSLLNFLEDNPGCMDAMMNWIQDNYEEDLKDSEEDSED